MKNSVIVSQQFVGVGAALFVLSVADVVGIWGLLLGIILYIVGLIMGQS